MGNITVKSKLEDIFDHWNIPILVCTKYDINNIIYSNVDIKKLDKSNYYCLDTFQLDCTDYIVYTNNTIFQNYKSKTFIISYEEDNYNELYEYITPSLCLYFNIKLNDINSFYNLFHKKSLISLRACIAENIMKSNFNFIWNGTIFFKNKYEKFQIDTNIEYSNKSITCYFSITNIQHLYDSNLKCIHNIANLDLDNDKDIDEDKDKFDIMPNKTNIISINIYNYVLIWLRKNKLNNYYIDEQNMEKYIIMDRDKLDILFKELNNIVNQFEIWFNPFFVVIRISVYKNPDLENIVSSLNGIIYKDNNIIEIRLPYSKDKLSSLRPKDIITKRKKKPNDYVIHLIDNNETNRLLLQKHLERNGYTVNTDIDININGYNNKNNILIYNINENYNIDIIRKKGLIMPIIISDNSHYSDRFYNYKISYPFNNDTIDNILNYLLTRVNVLYFDKDIRSSLLTKNMLNRLQQYNIYVEQNILKLESYIKSIDFQLIIIDSSIIDYYFKVIPQKYIQKINIPVLYLENSTKNIDYRIYTYKIIKPFSLETLNNHIMKCFS